VLATTFRDCLRVLAEIFSARKAFNSIKTIAGIRATSHICP